jgi:hypothetical protein
MEAKVYEEDNMAHVTVRREPGEGNVTGV